MTFESAYIERDNWNSQTRENSARGAWSWGTASTHGWGEHLFKKPIKFGLTYVEEPFVSYACALDDDDKVEDTRFPRCTGGVARWMQDKRDFYVGAYVFVTVATADPLLGAVSLYNSTLDGAPESEYMKPANYDITHHFTFFGLAIKDINASMFEE